MKQAYADVNGVRLHYVEAGEGRLILFLHGFPEFWHMWKNQLEEFSKSQRAVAVDLRGYNLSSKPPEVEAYDISLLIEDVRALAAHLGYQKLTLVGHDWGGVVAWAVALQHPDLLDILIIINAPHPAIFERELRENPAQQAASQYMLQLRSPDAEKILSANNYAALYEGVLKDMVERGHLSDRDREAYLEAWSQPGALTGGLNYYRAARVGPPSGDDAGGAAELVRRFPSLTVKVPTLVLWAEKDIYLLSSNLSGLERYVANLTIRRIPTGSHWVVHEKPDLINAYIRDFVASRR